jgi:catechol 2,3-dioxygenase-like lactoylglutathione lyase family enzyme
VLANNEQLATTLTNPLPMQTPFPGVTHLHYKVADLAKAKDWYSRVLQIEPYFDEPFYVGFNVAGYELGLQPDDNAAALAGRRRGHVLGRHGRPKHLTKPCSNWGRRRTKPRLR